MSEPSKEIVNLVVATVEDIANAKGYSSYPKEFEVIMVLTALMIVNEAINKKLKGKVWIKNEPK